MLIDGRTFASNTKNQINEITCDELREIKDSIEVLIDIREESEVSTGMIDGAVAISRGVLEMQITDHPAVKNEAEPLVALSQKPIYLYCRSGARSALAARSLEQMGLTNVYSLAGGIVAWNKL